MRDAVALGDDSSAESSARPQTRPSAERVLGGLAILGFAIPVAAYFWLIHHYAVNDVYLDQWGDVGILRHSYSGTLTLGTLWSQHHEERLLFPNLIVLALGYATHMNVIVEEYLSAVLLCLSALLFILCHKRRSSRSWLWYCPVAILMLSLVQSYSALFGFQLAWYLLILMLAVALYLLDRQQLSQWVLAGAMVAAFVGSFSSLPGLFIWPAGLVLLYQRRRRIGQAVVWCLGAVAAVFVYTYHYDASEGVPRNLSGFDLPGAAISSFFRVIGGVVGVHVAHESRGVSDGQFLFGVLLFVLAGYAAGHPRPPPGRVQRRAGRSGSHLLRCPVCRRVRLWTGLGRSDVGNLNPIHDVHPLDHYGHLPRAPRSTRPAAARCLLERKVGPVVAAVLAGAICLQVVLGTINGLRVASSFHRTQTEAAVVLVDVRSVPDPIMQGAFGSGWLAAELGAIVCRDAASPSPQRFRQWGCVVLSTAGAGPAGGRCIQIRRSAADTPAQSSCCQNGEGRRGDRLCRPRGYPSHQCRLPPGVRVLRTWPSGVRRPPNTGRFVRGIRRTPATAPIGSRPSCTTTAARRGPRRSPWWSTIHSPATLRRRACPPVKSCGIHSQQISISTNRSCALSSPPLTRRSVATRRPSSQSSPWPGPW